MKWGVVTLFPDMVESALSHGVIGRGLRDDCLSWQPSIHAIMQPTCISRWMTGPMVAVPEC